MDVLKSMRMEKFCNIVALEDCDLADAAYRAGYGIESHPTKDNYHTQIASRLLSREDVNLRINTIRMQNANKDSAYTNSLITKLKRILEFDMFQYVKSSNVVLSNGRTVTDYYLTKPIEEWSPTDRALICNGFDSAGRPKFIDKQWAWEKILKLYNLDGKNSNDVEDMLNLFTGAGLTTGLITQNMNLLNDIEEEEKLSNEIDKELDEDDLCNTETDIETEN